MTDKKIIEKLKLRDEKILDHLYISKYNFISRFLKSKFPVLSTDEIKDLYQDAIIVFWDKFRDDKFILTCSITTYLCSMVKFTALKRIETYHNRFVDISGGSRTTSSKSNFDGSKKLYDYQFKTTDDNQDTVMEVNDVKKIINEAMSILNDSDREILHLFYYENLSMKEIAKRMSFLNEDVAKTRKYKANIKIKKYITDRFKSHELLHKSL